MMRAIGVLASVVVLALHACEPAAAQTRTPEVSAGAPAPGAARVAAGAANGIVLRPGDMVRINVWRNPELSGDIVVDVDSTLRHPLYREVRAAGRPASEVVGMVRTVLRKYETEPQFVLEPLFRVVVSGEVRNPNVYTLGPDVTVVQAVALAGGATDRGRRKATLVRDGRRIAVDLERPSSGPAALGVRPGDQIVVEPERSSRWLGIATAALSVAASVVVLLRLQR